MPNILLDLPQKLERKYSEPLPEYFEIMAMIHRPVQSDLEGEYESKMIQLSTLNDGKPQRPKIEAMVTASHPGWVLWHWWTPEPDEF